MSACTDGHVPAFASLGCVESLDGGGNLFDRLRLQDAVGSQVLAFAAVIGLESPGVLAITLEEQLAAETGIGKKSAL